MYRNKRVIFLSHCILNQNTVVKPLARAGGAYNNIVKEILNRNIGIHQISCPEYRLLGLQRKPMSKQEYDSKEFRYLCSKIAKDTIEIMKEYIRNEYDIVGIIGIKQSPTCSITGNRGILMEELFNVLDREDINIRYFEVPPDYLEATEHKEILEDFKEFLS